MDTPFDPTLETDIKELMKEVPAPVRAFFASGKVETVAKNLMQKYRLHIDQGAVVEREVILLLLGLKGPEDFAKTLVEEAKLDQQMVNSIVQDVNAQVFVPLREELRRPAGSESRPLTPTTSSGQASGMRKGPTAVQQSPKPAQMPTAAPKYAPIPKFPHLLQNKISPSQNLPASSFQQPASRLLEDHEEPHIDIGVIHHPPLPTPPPPPPKPIQPTIPLPKPVIPPPPARPYSSDPYREPVDEK